MLWGISNGTHSMHHKCRGCIYDEVSTSKVMGPKVMLMTLLMISTTIAGCILDEIIPEESTETAIWDCRIEVPVAGLDVETYQAKIELHPGYPEWCGGLAPRGMLVSDPGPSFLDGSNSTLPPSDDLYGFADEWGSWGRNESHYVGTWPEPEECSTTTFFDIFYWIEWPENLTEAEMSYWDEEISMCATPVPCESLVDSQLIYEWCWPYPYVRYHWTGEYLYIGQVSVIEDLQEMDRPQPICPDGEPCICIDVDGSCEDGDDDWGYMGEEWVFYCSYDGAEYAEMMGGIYCANSELGFVE